MGLGSEGFAFAYIAGGAARIILLSFMLMLEDLLCSSHGLLF
jgi:hypothetical protein